MTGHGTDPRRMLPFRAFFAVASLDAIAGMLPWLAFGRFRTQEVLSSPGWHRDALVFGMVPAVIAGFLLTALPRWTGLPPLSRAGQRALLGLWLAGRLTHFGWPPLSLGLSAVFVLCLAGVVARGVARSHRMREWKIVALLVLLAAGAAAAARPDLVPTVPPGNRIGVVAVLGLVAVIGGRVAPALSASYLERYGTGGAGLPGPCFEVAAALALAVALGLWCLGPLPGSTALYGLAAFLQAARLVSWRPWRVAAQAGLLAIHLAYAWIPIGLALAALGSMAGSPISDQTVLHAWSVGAIGLMSLALMASMIRRQTRRPFSDSAWATASCACAASAAPARLLAEADAAWLLPAGFFWVAAFLFFLIGFRQVLLTQLPLSGEPR